MPKKGIRDFERRLARELGIIAILLQLERTPTGIHTYDLLKKAENTVFSRKEWVTKTIELIDEIIKRHGSGTTVQKEELLELVSSNFLIRYNRDILALLDAARADLIDEHISALRKLKTELDMVAESFDEELVIWNNISGIYPVMNNLEKSGLVEIIKEDTETGRLKKIYGITPLGRRHLQTSFSMVRELTEFFRPLKTIVELEESKNAKHVLSRKHLYNRDSSLVKAGETLFKKLDLNNVDLTDLENDQQSSDILLKIFFGPLVRIPSGLRMATVLMDQMQQVSGTREEIEMLKIVVRKKLKVLQKSIDTISNALDDI
ncbi:MAG: PadR family transcriptional regulator [Candidatus Odinarchaeota archaeon]